jgi:hypothetical protein
MVMKHTYHDLRRSYDDMICYGYKNEFYVSHSYCFYEHNTDRRRLYPATSIYILLQYLIHVTHFSILVSTSIAVTS